MQRTLLVLCAVFALACSKNAKHETPIGGQGGMAAGAEAPAAGNGGSSGAAGQAGAMTMDAGPSGTPLAARVCPPGPFGPPLPPEGPQRTATMVQDGFGFVEGPVWLAEEGVLLFSDMDFGATDVSKGPPSRIRRLTPPSSVDVLIETANSNGLALDLEGNILACTHDEQTLSRYDRASRARTTLSALRYDGARFNSPNDLTVRSDGTIYFTDPDWQLGPRDSETDGTNVYRVAPGGAVHLVTDALEDPNGIALSPDERTLYVGSAGSDILAFPVSSDGSTGGPRVFASAGGGTDGFTVDCGGNVYATGGGRAQVWNAAGDKLGEIAVAQGPTNVAFGGADRKTLYITARSALYSIVLLVPGLPY